MTNNQLDTSNTHDIICPHCGHKFGDSWEYNEWFRDGDMEISCRECDEPFMCGMDVTVNYTSYKKKENK